VRHEIVHNRRVVGALRDRGAVFVEQLDQVPADTPVIFSAHGVAKTVVAEARSRRLTYLDATCPLVGKVHREAERHHAQGRQLIIIGHAGHPEVEGTMGQLPAGASLLVQDIAEAEQVEVADPRNLAYVTQTTLSVDDTAAIVATLKARFPTIGGPRSEDICYATTNRQQAVKSLAGPCDVILVVGSANSSNSRRLIEVALANGCAQAFLIEGAEDIPWARLRGAACLGLTAGASAPEHLVEGVIASLGQRYQVTVEEVSGAEERIRFKLPRALQPLPAAE
jgi:4-hydroxy-3-methylbut-2-enyl diphosphate reductase